MKYEIKLTELAVAQLQETMAYISKVLQARDTAIRWSSRLQKEMGSLEVMPHRYALVDDEPWRSEGVRKMPVENFIVYYWVDDEDRIVWITAVVYGRRNQLMMLKNMPLLPS